MNLIERFKSERMRRFSRFLPALFFVGGFAWDAFFLGTRFNELDLVILVLYTIAAAVILLLLAREVRFRFSEHLGLALQFFLGGIYNALVIFYFISSANLGAFAVVVLLCALLVSNEILHKRYDRVTLSWTMFGVALTMLLNFVLPTLFHSIHPFWFYASSLAALAVVVLLRLAARQERASIVPTLIAVGLFMLLYAARLIPPVPLAQKKMLICHDLHRTARGYEAAVEQRVIPASWAFEQKIRQRPGEKIYCFTSVYVPRGIEPRITHRWLYFDSRRKEWIATTQLSVTIRSGRTEGYRGYSWKRNLSPG
jgi:hypothetical protein